MSSPTVITAHATVPVPSYSPLGISDPEVGPIRRNRNRRLPKYRASYAPHLYASARADIYDEMSCYPRNRITPYDGVVDYFYRRIDEMKCKRIMLIIKFFVPLHIEIGFRSLTRRAFCRDCIDSMCNAYQFYRIIDYVQSDATNIFRTFFSCDICNESNVFMFNADTEENENNSTS